MSVNIRKIQLEKLIFEELSCIVPYEMEDPRVVDIEITRVELSNDLKKVKVFFISRGNKDHELEEEILNRASGFIRFQISNAILLKKTPKFLFFLDEKLQEEIEDE